MRTLAALLILSFTLVRPALAAEPNDDARRLYAEGKAKFAQARYEEAVRLFEQVYALTEAPALLFNMAQAHRLAGPGHCARAVALYKSYLNSQPEAENRREVEERIAELGDCSREVPATTDTAAATSGSLVAVGPMPLASGEVREPAQTLPGLPTGPVLTAGAGAALVVAGGMLYWRAWDKHREAERWCPCYPGTYSNWEVLTNVSYVLLGVGGAAALGGITWWAFGDARSTGDREAVVGVRGSF